MRRITRQKRGVGISLDDVVVTQTIFRRFAHEFQNHFDVDVAIAGAGPAGLTAARYLAAAGKKVVIFERRLSIGGGIWGGGMTFPVLVVQEQSKHILKEVGIHLIDEKEGYYSADSIEVASKLCAATIDAGVRIFNTISVEDVLLSGNRVNGFVINWSAVEIANLHVDPLSIRAKYCIDATGHAAEICHIVRNKVGRLNTKSGDIEKERSMCADLGEKTVVENTKEVYPGLLIVGMGANAVFGSPRMGPVFGGMFLSGKKAADIILKQLK
ncbi:MAG: sulfide-dependent adenosine diphosphate thiazole synthase [Candidatus Thermoplasmatota archaeon]|nr:sulfide-dependent adenosine diphosphate thiazole synthase [Candidatus Thermoplasmatota archaeon]MBU1940410.1 sulfide-dependent adenosine diphosphate thiazole synthase [Candidatus Thermoplasmatota archaeon]